MPNHVRRSNQLPGERDGVLLEIIAEGKIPQHLEKSVMAIGEADVFEVVVLAAGAHALLRGSGALVVALLEPQENVLELVHPRVGEEQRGIADGHQRGTAHDAMAVGGKKVQKSTPNLVACEHVVVDS